MKKKITALCLCVALLAVAVVGASLAYFTDTKSAKNTFTVGDVSIKLIEQETVKDADGNVSLQTFTQNKKLVPGKSSQNAVSKIITVENTGKGDAWVWVELKIPKALISSDFAKEGAQSGHGDTYNALHINEYGAFSKDYYDGKSYTASTIADGILTSELKPTDSKMVDFAAENCWDGFDVYKVDDDYVYLRSIMQSKLPAGKVSLPCLRQVYMDWRIIANDDGSYTFPEIKDAKTGATLYAGTTIDKDVKWEIDVTAYAMQADGFDTAEAAIAAYNQ